MDFGYFLYLIYFATGLFAGLLAGLLGIGGGIVIVPVLFLLFSLLGYHDTLIIKLAAATSLATIIGTGASSALSHFRLGSLNLAWLQWLAPGVMLGAVAGMIVVDVAKASWLTMWFAGALVLIALHILRGARHAAGGKPNGGAADQLAGVEQSQNHFPHTFYLLPAGIVIGLLAALLGAGGGVFTVPLLLFIGGQMRAAVGASSAVGLCIAIPGVISAMLLGLNEPDLPSATLGYIVWPAAVAIVTGSVLTAPVGAKLAHRLPVEWLKRLFAGLLLVIGARMLWVGLAPLLV